MPSRALPPASSRITKYAKENYRYAPRKTWNQTACPPQKDSEEGKRLFSYQIEALPGSAGGRRARSEVCLQRPPAEQAPVPLAVDRAHQRRRQAERHQLLAAHPWPEGGRDRARSQDPGRPGDERCRCVQCTGQDSEGCCREAGRNLAPTEELSTDEARHLPGLVFWCV